jgi:Phospholipase_D-nuclease N-terminal
MLIYWLIHWFFDLLPWVTLFQVAMLIDCVISRKKSTKIAWIVFIVAIHGAGALFYFFFGPSSLLLFVIRALSHTQRTQYRQQQAYATWSPSPPPPVSYEQPPEESYGQGYLAQTTDPEEEELSYLSQDERPQTSYPPLPQQAQDMFR